MKLHKTMEELSTLWGGRFPLRRSGTLIAGRGGVASGQRAPPLLFHGRTPSCLRARAGHRVRGKGSRLSHTNQSGCSHGFDSRHIRLLLADLRLGEASRKQSYVPARESCVLRDQLPWESYQAASCWLWSFLLPLLVWLPR